MPLQIGVSIPWQFVWQLVHPPSIVVPHHSLKDHLDLELQAGLVLIEGLCESEGLETSCLLLLVSTHCEKSKQRHTFQNIETDAPKLIDVRMVNFGEEPDLGRRHRIVIRKKKLKLEDARWMTVRLLFHHNQGR